MLTKRRWNQNRCRNNNLGLRSHELVDVMANLVSIWQKCAQLRRDVRKLLAQTELQNNLRFSSSQWPWWRNKTVFPMPWKQWRYSVIQGKRSGGSDIRGFHNDTCAHLVGVAGRWGHDRVLAVSRRPAVSVVADEGGWVPRTGHSEVGLARADESGHTRKRTWGNPENWCVIVSSPDCTDTLFGVFYVTVCVAACGKDRHTWRSNQEMVILQQVSLGSHVSGRRRTDRAVEGI